MKKYLKHLLIALVGIGLLAAGTVFAATVAQVPQGGTGVSGITGIISGNGTSPFTPVTIGSGLTFDGTTLSSTGSAPVYPDTDVPFGDGTTPGGVTDSSFTYDNVGNIFNVTFDTADTGLTLDGGNQLLDFHSDGDSWLRLNGDTRDFQLGDLTDDWYGDYIDVNDDPSAQTFKFYSEGSARFTVDNVNNLVNMSAYPSTRDDSGTTAPINFLYTDSSGDVLSAPASALFSGGRFLIGQTSGLVSAPTPGVTTETWLGDGAGFGTASTNQTVFLGINSGFNATNAYATVAIGNQAGLNATNASSSEFIGQNAGGNATNASNSAFFGNSAGLGATNAANSLFLGFQAGNNDTVDNTLGGHSILIGDVTSTGGFQNSIALGTGATNTSANQLMIGSMSNPISLMTNPAYPSTRDDSGTTAPINFLYTDASGDILSAPWSAAPTGGLIGQTSGIVSGSAPISGEEVWLGQGAGSSGATNNNTTFMGYFAGRAATNAADAIFIGSAAGDGATNSIGSIFIGSNSGFNDASTGSGILIGTNTSTGGFSNSIALGTGATNTVANQFLVDPSYTEISLGATTAQFLSQSGVTQMGDTSGATEIQVDPANRDISNFANYNGTTSSLIFNSVYLDDGSVGYTAIGDDSGAKNGTLLTINDSSQDFSVGGTYGDSSVGNAGLFDANFANGTVSEGDLYDSGNGTIFKVDDPDQTFNFYGGSALSYTFPDTSPTQPGQVLQVTTSGVGSAAVWGNGQLPHIISYPVGSTITLPDNERTIIPNGLTITTLTIDLPASPTDNDRVEIKFDSAAPAITWSVPLGSVNDPTVSATAGTLISLSWDEADDAWY